MGRKRRTTRASKGQLLVQHLEGVSRTALVKYLPIIREYVRGKHGIYALYRGSRLYYVGLASNLMRRLQGHLKDRHANTWDRFSVYLTKGDRHLRELESLAIRIASPKGNLTKGGFVYSENLRRRFRRDMYKWMKQEIGGIFTTQEATRSARKTVRIKAKEKGKWPSLHDYVRKSFRIRMTYDGKTYSATVNRSGKIWCKKGFFDTPSGAARAVTGRHLNGWARWRYQRTQGEWVPLDKLRK